VHVSRQITCGHGSGKLRKQAACLLPYVCRCCSCTPAQQALGGLHQLQHGSPAGRRLLLLLLLLVVLQLLQCQLEHRITQTRTQHHHLTLHLQLCTCLQPALGAGAHTPKHLAD
jgi:hypothetical protein